MLKNAGRLLRNVIAYHLDGKELKSRKVMIEIMRTAGIPIMQPAQIADAVTQAVSSGATGEAFVCLPDKDHEKFVFTPVVGLGLDEGDIADLPAG